MQPILPAKVASSLDLSRALPTIVCALTASQVSGLGEVALMAGILSGYITEGPVLAGFLSGTES